MLPAHRVVGHKEYGNVGHPGRKSDPSYDMNWRRARVAAFKPRSGSLAPAPTPQAAGGFLMALNDAQQAEIYNSQINGERALSDWTFRRGQQLDRIEEMLRGGNEEGRNNFHWLRDEIATEVAEGLASSPAAANGVDLDALADRVVERLFARVVAGGKA
jgi:hypothetical protein